MTHTLTQSLSVLLIWWTEVHLDGRRRVPVHIVPVHIRAEELVVLLLPERVALLTAGDDLAWL